MEAIGNFQVLRPTTVEHAVQMFKENDNARYVAGGTDLLVNVRRGIAQPDALIELAAIDAMQTIEDNDGLTIGGGVTLTALLAHVSIKGPYQALADAAAVVAAATHRHVATVGGNLCLDTRCVFYNQSEWWRDANAFCLKNKGETCHVAPKGDTCFAAFSGDLAPAFLALDASVDVVGPAGARRMPLSEIYQDDGLDHLRLDAGDIVVAVHVPNRVGWESVYEKVRIRDAIDFPLVGAAVAAEKQNDTVTGLHVALTGTNSQPFVLEGSDAFLGKAFDADTVEAVVKLISKQIQPMSSTVVAPGYRRKVIANLVRKLVGQLTA